MVVISRWRAVVTVFGPGRDYRGWQRQLRSVAPLVPLRLDHVWTLMTLRQLHQTWENGTQRWRMIDCI